MHPAKQISLRLSYAGGFRAPQAFDEDMHIAVVGGDRVRILLADGLKEERSHSVSLSADIYRQIRIQLHAGVRNLFDAYQRDFDRGADRDSGYIYGPSIPRSWVAGIKVSF